MVGAQPLVVWAAALAATIRGCNAAQRHVRCQHPFARAKPHDDAIETYDDAVQGFIIADAAQTSSSIQDQPTTQTDDISNRWVEPMATTEETAEDDAEDVEIYLSMLLQRKYGPNWEQRLEEMQALGVENMFGLSVSEFVGFTEEELTQIVKEMTDEEELEAEEEELLTVEEWEVRESGQTAGRKALDSGGSASNDA